MNGYDDISGLFDVEGFFLQSFLDGSIDTVTKAADPELRNWKSKRNAKQYDQTKAQWSIGYERSYCQGHFFSCVRALKAAAAVQSLW